MKTYIDVGCNVGYYSFRWLSDPDVRVFAFEPNPKAFQLLKEKETDRFRVFDYAIGTEDGIKDFNVGERAGTSSLKDFIETNTAYKVEERITVTVKRLDSFCDEHKISEIELLKIDAQGSDLDVLKSLGGNINSVKAILIEAFIDGTDCVYKGEVKEHEVMEYMKVYNFELTGRTLSGNSMDLLFKHN